MAQPRRVTLRDISADTGLSVAAVSYALRGLHVPEETQIRVRESAERLGYKVNPIARALASGRSDQVGVMCRSLADLWQQGTSARLGRALLATGRQALIVDSCDDPDLEERLARRLLDQRVDALLTFPVNPAAEHWAQAAQETVLVSIGDALPGAATYAEIVFDNQRAVRSALDGLVGLGHSRIAVLTHIDNSTPDRPIELVVQQMAEDSHADIRLHTCMSDLEGSATVVTRLLQGADPPTAFCCLADSMAYGVYSAARALGLSIPEDISVVGNDDNPISTLLTPPLWSYEWPVSEVVSAIVDATTEGVVDEIRRGRTVISAREHRRASAAAPPGADS
ncbi:MAG: LacI family DNA-binding transcriptional regulator [Actinomycetales bacterium]